LLITKSEKKDLKIGFLKKNCETMKSEVIKSIILLASLLSVTFAQSEKVSSVLCGIVMLIKSVSVVLAIAMFVIGGILYAVGNLLTGQMKQSAHGWAQGLIIGGIIALILIILAQPVVNLIAQAGNLTPVNCG
jgi:hypothetical protein